MTPGEHFNPSSYFKAWFRVPQAIARFPGLTPGAKLTYGVLAWHAGKNGRCYPSHELLAKELGVSRRHVKRYLAELRQRCLIEWKRGRRCNFYRFIGHEAFLDGTDTSHQKEPDRTDTSHQHGTDTSHLEASDRTDTSYKTKKSSNEEKAKRGRLLAAKPLAVARWRDVAKQHGKRTDDDSIEEALTTVADYEDTVIAQAIHWKPKQRSPRLWINTLRQDVEWILSEPQTAKNGSAQPNDVATREPLAGSKCEHCGRTVGDDCECADALPTVDAAYKSANWREAHEAQA